MEKSFYQYMMKHRGALKPTELSKFAEEIFRDPSFPKHSKEYHDISTYLELNDFPLDTVRIFDQAWNLYLLEE